VLHEYGRNAAGSGTACCMPRHLPSGRLVVVIKSRLIYRDRQGLVVSVGRALAVGTRT